MTHLRLLSRSVAVAVILMSLSTLFAGMAGELIALPGMTFDLFVNVSIMMSTKSDFYPEVENALLFNLIFYSASIYLGSWLYDWVRGALRNAA